MSLEGQQRPIGADDDLVLCNLASGSKGNATYVGKAGIGLLVDVGISAKQAELRLRKRGIDPQGVAGIVITHEHGDHARGVRVFARRFNVPVHVHEGAMPGVDLDRVPDVRPFSGDRPLEIGGLEVRPFSIPHDTVEPLAYVVSDGTHSAGIATDMGMPTRLAVERLRRCQAVVLESNHDLRMLMEGPYPWWLKQRVHSRLGHLSNDDALTVLEQIADSGVQVALLGHLSEENNDPALVHALALDRLEQRGNGHVRITVLRQHEPGPVVRVGRDVLVQDLVEEEGR